MTSAARNGPRRLPHAEFCPILNPLEGVVRISGSLFFILASNRAASEDSSSKKKKRSRVFRPIFVGPAARLEGDKKIKVVSEGGANTVNVSVVAYMEQVSVVSPLKSCGLISKTLS